ncbi:hypothetical protein ACI01nite_22970 [Acetobacter cibinongensis]|uniref:Uncharacterized protein n=1 Tax=Acetobacter cibinongensis TaxID=146475 RepID=A0A0D6N617_9PROT|nr:hypothetical protein [Acetobacter cibinongensis]GAN61399.1 hypothetical protein Abci_019_013 [Acetobacter cibinongensis]GBQ14129.1 hypothetical protein AA0482_0807 [Acetobacter cibinongensis NRIC 0482]GEL59695.1 hypothetical protein ACI01nite_22970 [Acetobacter cibinongensis]
MCHTIFFRAGFFGCVLALPVAARAAPPAPPAVTTGPHAVKTPSSLLSSFSPKNQIPLDFSSAGGSTTPASAEAITVHGKKFLTLAPDQDDTYPNGRKITLPGLGKITVHLGNGDDRHDPRNGAVIGQYGTAYRQDLQDFLHR